MKKARGKVHRLIVLSILVLFSFLLYWPLRNLVTGEPIFSRSYRNNYFTVHYPLKAKVVDVLEPARENDPSWLKETLVYVRIDKGRIENSEAYGVIRVTSLDTLGAINNIKSMRSGLERPSIIVSEKPTTFKGYEGVELNYEVSPFYSQPKGFYKYVVIPRENNTYILGFSTDSLYEQDFSSSISFRIRD